MRRFIVFHGKRHPAELTTADVATFLSALADGEKVSASTQNQALCALLFLYSNVLGKELGALDSVVWAKRPARLPVVLSRREVGCVLENLHGVPRLVATLLYGSGLRLTECLELRVKDIDFDQRQIGALRAFAAEAHCVSRTGFNGPDGPDSCLQVLKRRCNLR